MFIVTTACWLCGAGRCSPTSASAAAGQRGETSCTGSFPGLAFGFCCLMDSASSQIPSLANVTTLTSRFAPLAHPIAFSLVRRASIPTWPSSANILTAFRALLWILFQQSPPTSWQRRTAPGYSGDSVGSIADDSIHCWLVFLRLVAGHSSLILGLNDRAQYTQEFSKPSRMSGPGRSRDKVAVQDRFIHVQINISAARRHHLRRHGGVTTALQPL